MEQGNHFVNNRWVEGGGLVFTSKNPADGEVVWSGKQATENEVNEALRIAKESFPKWRSQHYDYRRKCVERFINILEKNKHELALVISKEIGKPLWESLTEVSAMIAKFAISDKAYQQRTGEAIKTDNGVSQVLRHRPHGALIVLGPFNFPGHLPNGHILPALLAGNTIVYKPSEAAPLVGETIMRYWQEAELPDGVINMVQGGRETGKVLIENPDAKGILFTGSYSAGHYFHTKYAGKPEKLLVMEMGGNNPLIVHEISNIAAAAYCTLQSAYITSGQRCTCARRLIIPVGDEGDKFINELIRWVENIKVGVYTDNPEPFMGPVVSLDSAEKLLDAQTSLLNKGAHALVKMQHLKIGTGLISPGLIDTTDIPREARVDEEYFGPLLQIIRVENFQAAIEEANNTEYGLAAGLLSDNYELYKRFYEQSYAGIINWNRPLTGASSSAPFGGVGKSGNFHPSAYYAADYCAYPVASMEQEHMVLPETLLQGIQKC